MRWLLLTGLGILTLVVQVTLAPRVALWGARPDWMLALVVFVGLRVKGPHAIIAGWCLGLGTDVLSIERLGLMSLCYGLTAAIVQRFREWVFTWHPLTHFALTTGAGLFVQTLTLIYRWSVHDWAAVTSTGEISRAFVTAVWSGIWAVPIQWLLLKLPYFGRRRQRKSYAPRWRARW